MESSAVSSRAGAVMNTELGGLYHSIVRLKHEALPPSETQWWLEMDAVNVARVQKFLHVHGFTVNEVRLRLGHRTETGTVLFSPKRRGSKRHRLYLDKVWLERMKRIGILLMNRPVGELAMALGPGNDSEPVMDLHWSEIQHTLNVRFRGVLVTEPENPFSTVSTRHTVTA